MLFPESVCGTWEDKEKKRLYTVADREGDIDCADYDIEYDNDEKDDNDDNLYRVTEG